MKHALTVTLAAALGTTLLAAGAAAAKSPPEPGLTQDQCFRTDQIQSHKIADGRTILLKVQGKGVYRLTTAGLCAVASGPQETLVTSTVGDSGRVCRPIDLDLKILRPGGATSPCIIQSITRMTDAEVAALPAKKRP